MNAPPDGFRPTSNAGDCATRAAARDSARELRDNRSRMSLNSGFEYEERVGRESAGRTVLEHLSGRYPHSSAADWSARIAEGAVRLDGRRVETSTRLAPGQRLAWRRPPWEEPDAPQGFALLYRDADVLGVAKPRGLPTLPGGGFLERTLLHRVRVLFPGASPLHRLGRHTSGLVLFARTREAHAALSRAFARREVRKRYRALATGDPRADAFDVDTPIGLVPHALLGSVHAATASDKPAHSRVQVVERREGAFLCDVWISTGRPHQIRIHLAACGHPLVGDPLYVTGGLPAPASRALPGDPGYRLHAAELAFVHPRTGRETVWTCPAPAELRRSA
jgi:23S rRNA pseudouridine1911/1915/1917 synthase